MRLIDADELKRAIEDRIDYVPSNDYDEGWNSAINTAIDEIDNAPTVADRYDEGYAQGYEEKLQGEWITKGYEPFGKCNICGGICEINNFCGHCGVKMKYNTKQ